MSLEPYPQDDGLASGWSEMGVGAPTIIALAQLCTDAMKLETPEEPALSKEASAILYAAKDRGVIEVKGVNTAFEAPSRFLAIYVELDEERTIVFRSREKPEVTIRFFEGFRQLCQLGLVMHHLYRDFSLTVSGFERARSIDRATIEQQLSEGREFGLHD